MIANDGLKPAKKKDREMSETSEELIVSALERIGCEIPSQRQLKYFTASMLRSAIRTCIQTIKPTLELPPPVTDSSAASVKFKVTQRLVDMIKGLGYMNELGYNQLLYPSERDSRDVLAWLTEKLPRVKTAEASLTSGQALWASMRSALSTWDAPRVPLCRRTDVNRIPFVGRPINMKRPLSAQTSAQELLPALLETIRSYEAEVELDTQPFMATPAPPRPASPLPEPEPEDAVEDHAEMSRLEQMAVFQHEEAVAVGGGDEEEEGLIAMDVDQLVAKTDELRAQKEQAEATKAAAEAKQREIETEREANEKVIADKTRALEKLTIAQEMAESEDVDETLAALKAKAEGKLAKMTAEWEAYIGDTRAKLEEVTEAIRQFESQFNDSVESLKSLKAESKSRLTQLRDAEATLARMQEVEGTDVRGGILEAIRDLRRSARKQVSSMMSVRIDAKEMRGEVTRAGETVHKVFEKTRESMGKKVSDAKKKAFMGSARRGLNEVHMAFAHLEKLTESIYDTERLITETSRKAATEGAGAGELNVEAIAGDVAALRAENKEVAAKLRDMQ